MGEHVKPRNHVGSASSPAGLDASRHAVLLSLDTYPIARTLRRLFIGLRLILPE